MLKSLFAAALLLSTTAFAKDAKLPRTISLVGHGEVHATPDIAIVTMGVLTSAITAQEALAANTKSMTDLMAVLKTASVENKDISTSNFSVNPRYDYGANNGQPPKVTGYDVSNNVTVILRKIDKVGDLLDKVVTAGSNQINGVSFTIDNPQAAVEEASKAAVADAKRKAELYVGAASASLGNVISISEGGAYQPPMPMRAKMLAADSSGGAPVPISQGEQVIGVDVNITWEIK